MEKYLTVKQMIECEHYSDKNAYSLKKLMDNAAEGLFKAVLRAYERCERRRGFVTIAVGKGNNGGDGLVLARLLCDAGFKVNILLLCGEPATELSLAAFGALPEEAAVYNAFDTALLDADMFIDCVFGTGFSGTLRAGVKEVFKAVNSADIYRVACDIPSGCNALTGECDEDSFRADMTVTFHSKKLGMGLSPARYNCGEVTVHDIGIPASFTPEGTQIKEYTFNDIKPLLPSRPPYGHKGSFGRVLCITGSDEYIGAAAMSANAALRCGAGLVCVASGERVINALAGSMFECTYLPLKSCSFDEISGAAKGASCILIGCGLGRSEEKLILLQQIIKHSDCPVVIDADGLNMLAGDMSVLGSAKSSIVLTPHIGELARLCGVTIAEAVQNRPQLINEIALKYKNVTVVSKSAETLTCTGDRCILTRFGNTALAKGGSGDMLSGMISSFIAQGAAPADAALLGTAVLGHTAESLTSDGLSPRGILARDILNKIPHTLSAFEE